ncbi:MAG: ABC transporter ATP-binding protein [Coriobacteriia bacterium]|nr:ABC transporter ATP-binding protein [Coriobacteriia bacterium]
MTDVINIDGITFSYRRPKKLIFRDFTTTFTSGQITCILGYNGAGKTTLLKLIYGILRPKEGLIAINNELVSNYADIFILSDRFGICPELSLRQNLVFRCRLHSLDTSPILAHPLIYDFGMARFIDTPANKLSAGYFTRANIVTGLVFQPSLVMLDEPTSSIDPATRELLQGTLAKQRMSGTSIILVTHDLDFAYAVGDRLIVIDEGNIVVDSLSPRDIPIEAFRNEYILHTESDALQC